MLSPTTMRRPRRQSRHGLQVGIASDALARIRDVA
jgi:hypothetical protein